MRKYVCSLVSAALVVSMTTSVARADGKSFLGGAIVGGAAALIFNNVQKQKQPKRSRGQSSQQRQRNMEIQTRLNVLGFKAGPVDGQPGRKTRAAIRSFQTAYGFPVTGRLTEGEFQQLVLATSAQQPAQVQQNAVAVQSAPKTAQPQINNTATQAHSAPLVDAAPTETQNFATSAVKKVAPVAVVGSAVASSQTEAFPVEEAGFPVDAFPLDEENESVGKAEEKRPAIYGISAGVSASEVDGLLASNNVQNCETTKTATSCVKENDDMRDVLTIGYSETSNGRYVSLVSRELQFANPQPRYALEGMLKEYFPKLLEVDGHVMASSDDCKAYAAPLQTVGFSPIKKWYANGSKANKHVDRLFELCGTYYSVNLAAEAEVKAVHVDLFAGKPL